MATVIIVQRIVPHYRVPFFKRLAERLAAMNIDFRLVYGREYPGTVPATMPVNEDWAIQVDNKYFTFAQRQLVWQKAWRHAKASDLVIVEQASSQLLNYWLLLYRLFGRTRVAYWGQGVNVRTPYPNSLAERIKAALLGRVDWWFAYSAHTHAILRRARYPERQITVVQNAVDDETFKQAIESVTAQDRQDLRTSLGIVGNKVGLYCGAFIPPKRMKMVIASCVEIRRRMPDFEAIIIGSGPDQHVVEAAAAEYPWLHYVGPKFGGERAPYFLISDVLIQPGTIGLVIIDSFVAEVPLFTTDQTAHGPEIAFLENGYNGYATPDSLEAYVNAVCEFFDSASKRHILLEGCRQSAYKYSMDAMVTNMATGIGACLGVVRDK